LFTDTITGMYVYNDIIFRFNTRKSTKNITHISVIAYIRQNLHHYLSMNFQDAQAFWPLLLCTGKKIRICYRLLKMHIKSAILGLNLDSLECSCSPTRIGLALLTGTKLWTVLQLSVMIIYNSTWSILIQWIRDILSGDNLTYKRKRLW